MVCFFFVFKQKTAYEMRISDWSSDVCSSDLDRLEGRRAAEHAPALGVEPVMQLVDDRAGPRLADGKALLGRATVDLALDVVEQPDQIGSASCRGRVCQYV